MYWKLKRIRRNRENDDVYSTRKANLYILILSYRGCILSYCAFLLSYRACIHPIKFSVYLIVKTVEKVLGLSCFGFCVYQVFRLSAAGFAYILYQVFCSSDFALMVWIGISRHVHARKRRKNNNRNLLYILLIVLLVVTIFICHLKLKQYFIKITCMLIAQSVSIWDTYLTGIYHCNLNICHISLNAIVCLIPVNYTCIFSPDSVPIYL